MADRIPPHDLDAEAAVISAVLLAPDRLGELSDAIETKDFYADAHRRVWDAMLAVDGRGDPIDATTVWAELKATRRACHVGVDYLSQLTDATPAVANAVDHARIVRSLARVRGLQLVANEILHEGYAPIANVSDWLAKADERVFNATRGIETDDSLAPVRDQVRAYIDAEDSTAERVPTGLTTLDRMLGGGLVRGELYVVAGRPGMGKTGFVLKLAATVAETSRSLVAYVASLEMSRAQLTQRAISCDAAIDNRKIGDKTLLAPHDWDAVARAADRVSRLNLWIDDRAGQTVPYIRSKIRTAMSRARRSNASLRLGAIVVDYIQLMTGEGRTREEQVSGITRGLKSLAREFDAPVVALSQLNRGVESREDKRPKLSDLRESGAIEQDAFGVLMLYRDEYYFENSGDAGIAEVHVSKLRQGGKTGRIKVAFQGECTRFSDLAPDDPDYEVPTWMEDYS